MNKMEKLDLGMYEAPSIAENISIGWMQELMARYIAWKVNRKWKRYEVRLARNKFFKAYPPKSELKIK